MFLKRCDLSSTKHNGFLMRLFQREAMSRTRAKMTSLPGLMSVSNCNVFGAFWGTRFVFRVTFCFVVGRVFGLQNPSENAILFFCKDLPPTRYLRARHSETNGFKLFART